MGCGAPDQHQHRRPIARSRPRNGGELLASFAPLCKYKTTSQLKERRRGVPTRTEKQRLRYQYVNMSINISRCPPPPHGTTSARCGWMLLGPALFAAAPNSVKASPSAIPVRDRATPPWTRTPRKARGFLALAYGDQSRKATKERWRRIDITEKEISKRIRVCYLLHSCSPSSIEGTWT